MFSERRGAAAALLFFFLKKIKTRGGSQKENETSANKVSEDGFPQSSVASQTITPRTQTWLRALE